MQAYEFYTTAENGIIRIPDEYKNKIKSKIKVIVVEEKSESIRDILLPPTLDTRGFAFDREEANER